MQSIHPTSETRSTHSSPDAGSNSFVRSIILATALVAVGGCVSATPRSFAPSGVPESAVDIPVKRVGANAAILGDGGMLDSARIVVRNERQWRDVWSRLAAGTPQLASPPEVDFSREMVLVATLGSRPVGHGIQVQKVSRVGDVVYADIVTRLPGAQCSTVRDKDHTVTAPADVVIVPATRDPVAFVERQTRRPC